jgi:SAM-dependent methyltransferase
MRTYTVLGAGPAAYEEHLVPIMFRPLADRLVTLVEPGPGGRVLDVACGTGAVARRAVAAGAEVTAIDRNPAMLALARTLEPAVRWEVGDAAALPFPDGSFDVVYCQQGMQFFPDPAAALREMRRVLVPGGRLAVAVWRDVSRSPGYAVFADVLDRHAGPAAGDIMRGPFAAPPVRDLVVAAGFTADRLLIHIVPARFRSVPALFAEEVAASPLAEPIGALADGVREELVRDLGAALADHLDDAGVVFPMETYIITARK